ncbi:MAG: STAS domain-containing protein [Candidatus Krumholzibacteria bacterium]|nr:STAS domain-containing protein [Candidatus Krumholzibacteria bacterium]
MDRLLIKEDWIEAMVVLKLHGLIDSGTSQLLEDKFRELMAANNTRVVIDLQEISYISSAGWGIFVGEIKGIRRRNGDIKLAGMTPDVREVFDLLEFNALLTPYNSKEDAMAAFETQDNEIK